MYQKRKDSGGIATNITLHNNLGNCILRCFILKYLYYRIPKNLICEFCHNKRCFRNPLFPMFIRKILF